MQGSFLGLIPSRWTLSVAVALQLGCTATPEVALYPGAGEPVVVSVEVAASPDTRSRGLMYRKDLPVAGGMLFVFPSAADHRFWMKNTPLALDMIFIGEDLRVVGVVSDAVPFSTASLGVGQPSRYVLEVHAGFARRHQVRPGVRVELRRIPPAGS